MAAESDIKRLKAERKSYVDIADRAAWSRGFDAGVQAVATNQEAAKALETVLDRYDPAILDQIDAEVREQVVDEAAQAVLAAVYPQPDEVLDLLERLSEWAELLEAADRVHPQSRRTPPMTCRCGHGQQRHAVRYDHVHATCLDCPCLQYEPREEGEPVFKDKAPEQRSESWRGSGTLRRRPPAEGEGTLGLIKSWLLWTKRADDDADAAKAARSLMASFGHRFDPPPAEGERPAVLSPVEAVRDLEAHVLNIARKSLSSG